MKTYRCTCLVCSLQLVSIDGSICRTCSFLHSYHMSVEQYTQGKWVDLLRLAVKNTPGIGVYMNQTNKWWQNMAWNQAIKSNSRILR
jgi:hypothetical protein